MLRATRAYSLYRMVSAPAKPLVVIIGATGTGKSDLAVEIARKFDGEIINGDAVQLYQGLPIITNKITPDEMRGVPHHLLGCIGFEEETWSVGKFVGKALGVIEEIRSRGKLPILVGGTHYYTQSLIFQDALADGKPLTGNEDNQRYPILDEPTEIILKELEKVDPVMAQRWHPNDRRKIQRSLEIYLRTGKLASKVYEEQRSKRDTLTTNAISEDETTSRLRFPTLLLWVHASRDVLHVRVGGRILKMVKKGLLDEVKTLVDFRISHEAKLGIPVDQTRGIWVSIGYKEFLDYEAASKDATCTETDLEDLMSAAVEKTQAATRQYSNRQVRWIRIKLLNALYNAGQNGNIFLLDGSDLTTWEDQVKQPALELTKNFLAGQTLPEPTTLSDAATEMLSRKRDYDLSQRPDLWQKKVCEICGTFAITENEWNQHLKSRSHRTAIGKKKKQENSQRVGPRDKKALQKDMIDVLQVYQQNLSAVEEST
ncbi:IPP transferase-domain-containing protein [Dendryphion nanum]|uniref:tRNA dimethylallyltransferase n=1 Tax=Dendryphion nanum TaxID=256645 RepID=A0A9P9ISZ8_9PLEO|nr:IPP transferase-domain-containing protein [Dendryphion nanum]